MHTKVIYKNAHQVIFKAVVLLTHIIIINFWKYVYIKKITKSRNSIYISSEMVYVTSTVTSTVTFLKSTQSSILK